MNSLKTKEQSVKTDQVPTLDRQPSLNPALATIVKLICADARSDSLKYAIRSDTGHDGE